MFAWRHLHTVSLLLVLASTASADDEGTGCGTVLGGPIHGDTICVLCPTLPELSELEAHEVIAAVLNQTSRVAGNTWIVFLSDPSVLERDWQYQDMERRLESWGDSFVGTYQTNSGLLTVRSATDGKWRNISLRADELDYQQDALILNSFEQPLRSELLMKGYTPRNAAIASQHLLEEFIRCWKSDRNAEPHSEPSTVVTQLGGKSIVTYQSPCLTEFLGNVESLP